MILIPAFKQIIQSSSCQSWFHLHIFCILSQFFVLFSSEISANFYFLYLWIFVSFIHRLTCINILIIIILSLTCDLNCRYANHWVANRAKTVAKINNGIENENNKLSNIYIVMFIYTTKNILSSTEYTRHFCNNTKINNEKLYTNFLHFFLDMYINCYFSRNIKTI